MTSSSGTHRRALEQEIKALEPGQVATPEAENFSQLLGILGWSAAKVKVLALLFVPIIWTMTLRPTFLPGKLRFERMLGSRSNDRPRRCPLLRRGDLTRYLMDARRGTLASTRRADLRRPVCEKTAEIAAETPGRAARSGRPLFLAGSIALVVQTGLGGRLGLGMTVGGVRTTDVVALDDAALR